jgi:hypothetical protein
MTCLRKSTSSSQMFGYVFLCLVLLRKSQMSACGWLFLGLCVLYFRSPCDLVSDLLAHRKSRKPYKLKGSYRTATGQLQGSYRAATLQLKPKGHLKSSEPQASWSSFSPFSRIDFPGRKFERSLWKRYLLDPFRSENQSVDSLESVTSRLESWLQDSKLFRSIHWSIHRRFFVEASARSSAFPEQRLTSCAGGCFGSFRFWVNTSDSQFFYPTQQNGTSHAFPLPALQEIW